MFDFVNVAHRCHKSTSVAMAQAKNPPAHMAMGHAIIQATNMCGSSTPGACARVKAGCPSGTGYQLCGVGGNHLHAEELLPLKIAEFFAADKVGEIEAATRRLGQLRAEGHEASADAVFDAAWRNLFAPYDFTVTVDGHVGPCQVCAEVLAFFGLNRVHYTGMAVRPQEGETLEQALARAQRQSSTLDMQTFPAESAVAYLHLQLQQ